MSTTTELVQIPPESIALFPGATTPDEVIAEAAKVATRFADVVKQQRLFKRIGDRDHILIEAWQTIGSLVAVFAVKDGGVRDLPWPPVEQITWIADEPPDPGPEPKGRGPTWDIWKEADELRKQFEHHQTLMESYALGRTFGCAAAFRVVKNGEDVGWGEGRVNRSERNWAGREDHAISSMTQTRGQSRALSAPLRFLVKLAGYEPTLPDDLPEEPPTAAPEGTPAPTAPWGPVVESDAELEGAAALVKDLAPEIDATKFVLDMGAYFDGVPKANLKMLRALARRMAEAREPIETDAEVVTT